MRLDRFTVKFQEALADAQSLAVGHDNQFIEPAHVLSALLAQEDPTELLTILKTRKEVPRLIWTNEMRDQLLEFVNNRIHDQGETGNTHLEMASDFIFDAIKDELIVGDVYVRVYNNQNPKNFERADEFCEAVEGERVLQNDRKIGDRRRF